MALDQVVPEIHTVLDYHSRIGYSIITESHTKGFDYSLRADSREITVMQFTNDLRKNVSVFKEALPSEIIPNVDWRVRRFSTDLKGIVHIANVCGSEISGHLLDLYVSRIETKRMRRGMYTGLIFQQPAYLL